MKALDLFVLTSTNEGMGRVFVEAQAAGVPVVGSNVCGIGNVVNNNRSGFLFPPDDPEPFIEAIAKLCEDRELRDRMAEEASLKVTKEFEVEGMAKRIEEVYLGELKNL